MTAYDYIPVILSHNFDINAIKGTKAHLFQMKHFSQQKFKVTLLQQSLTNLLNSYLPEWTIEIFENGFGVKKASDVYRRDLILICKSGCTGKSTIARLLSFALGFSNYVCLSSFPTQKRRQSMIYFLSKFKRQVVIFDLVRATFGRIDSEAIKKKVEDEVEEEIKILDDSQRDEMFSQKLIARELYQKQVLKRKKKISGSIRQRLVYKCRLAASLGSIEGKKMGTFIEACTQGFSAEERYFIKITLRETPMRRLIVNNKEYMKHMSPDYEKNAYVLVIDEKNCIPNKIGVKYYHLLNGFVRNEIFGHIFDGASNAMIDLADLGVCSDLLERSPKP